MFKIKARMNGDFNISKQRISLKCPNCKMSHTVSLEDIQKEKVINCNCGKEIQLRDKDKSVNKTINDINKSLNSLKQTIEKLGK